MTLTPRYPGFGAGFRVTGDLTGTSRTKGSRVGDAPRAEVASAGIGPLVTTPAGNRPRSPGRRRGGEHRRSTRSDPCLYDLRQFLVTVVPRPRWTATPRSFPQQIGPLRTCSRRGYEGASASAATPGPQTVRATQFASGHGWPKLDNRTLATVCGWRNCVCVWRASCALYPGLSWSGRRDSNPRPSPWQGGSWGPWSGSPSCLPWSGPPSRPLSGLRSSELGGVVGQELDKRTCRGRSGRDSRGRTSGGQGCVIPLDHSHHAEPGEHLRSHKKGLPGAFSTRFSASEVIRAAHQYDHATGGTPRP